MEGPIYPTRRLIEYHAFAHLRENREWLAENAWRRVTLQEAAAHSGFSPFHYQRLFLRAFGETPHEFLTRLRMERAKRILRTSSDPVTEICFDLGYESLGSFSALFAREVGLPPSQYRRIYSTPGIWALKCTPACFRGW
ncbi:MAG TPA: AraC family transcriptional regulator [Fimbriimonadaceae bacterium]|nr:AraC family transcriptional regulator [Fimbriimonadaceae bacterium]